MSGDSCDGAAHDVAVDFDSSSAVNAYFDDNGAVQDTSVAAAESTASYDTSVGARASGSTPVNGDVYQVCIYSTTKGVPSHSEYRSTRMCSTTDLTSQYRFMEAGVGAALSGTAEDQTGTVPMTYANTPTSGEYPYRILR